MLYLYILVGIFLVLGFGSAIYMGKRFKKQAEEHVSQSPTILTDKSDLEPLIRLLAEELSKNFAKEIKEALKDLNISQPVYQQGYISSGPKPVSDFGIQIDDKIIPMNVSTEKVEAKVAFNQKTEAVDTGLNESKNKLASLLKKKDK